MAARKQKDNALNEVAAQEPSPAPDLPDLNVSVTREEPSIDPELVKLRDREIAELSKVQVQPRQDAVLDPDLAKLRDAEAEAEAKRLHR